MNFYHFLQAHVIPAEVAGQKLDYPEVGSQQVQARGLVLGKHIALEDQ
jgi:hypothetical protein